MSDFKYNLPEELIAKYPPKIRGTSNLLVLNREDGKMEHKKYYDIPEYIEKGDLVVLNSTKVLNCRTYFVNSKDRRFEVFFIEERDNRKWFCLIGGGRNISSNEVLRCEEIGIRVLEKIENGFEVEFIEGSASSLFLKYGHVPLPPYIKRGDENEDVERYNTVFSSVPGAVAAPTASLNLTKEILGRIKERGADIVEIELRVGWGTFAPVREENIENHMIHREYICVNNEVAEKVNRCKGRVWAFGTTTARALESTFDSRKQCVKPFNGYTDLYIYPGYRWNVVDVLVTNFHMPDSSLILLVSSFAGKEKIRNAYEEGIRLKYNFLSYGDSMLIK